MMIGEKLGKISKSDSCSCWQGCQKGGGNVSGVRENNDVNIMVEATEGSEGKGHIYRTG